MKKITYTLSLLCIILFCISCKKNRQCNSETKIIAISVKSPIQNDSFTLNYNSKGKITEVTKNGFPYFKFYNINDTSISMVNSSDTSGNNSDSIWCAIQQNRITNFRKSYGITYNYYYNNTGGIDSVKDYFNGVLYNYSFYGTSGNELRYTNRVVSFCGLPNFCLNYFSDTIHFESNAQRFPMPDQFIYTNFSDMLFNNSGSLSAAYLLALNGYFTNFDKTKRITKWTAILFPFSISLPPVKYTIKYFYTFNTDDIVSKIRTETYDADGSIFFYKEYYFYYHSDL